MTQRASPQMLARAEAFSRELDEEAEVEDVEYPGSDEEALRRRLEESRFDDV